MILDRFRSKIIVIFWQPRHSLPPTEERRQGVPMRRYGRSDEIAVTVAFLASDGTGYMTGQNIRVDGGLTV